ncbi:hypothetical protein FA13DRAFT_1524298 [Coprinellus micaceus]|uniref:Uncharacterized protein n=1 Tax=Coprinellus micaceus TaxID=71717 RepID=A0A4Y7SLH2_COPMI|nr:hypothetical protein FA13DRAFT_1524298 [Coprinellus micaceus]
MPFSDTHKPQKLSHGIPARTGAQKTSLTDPADDPHLQPKYIFTVPADDHPPPDKSLKNPKTSRAKRVEAEESLQELGYRVYELKDLPARAIFGEASDPCKVENFLKASESGYDIVRNVWGALPLDPANESDLRSHFVNILNSVTSYFHPSPPAGTTREAVDSHGIPMIHDNRTHYTSPGISIKAAGPSFEVPDDVGLSPVGLYQRHRRA